MPIPNFGDKYDAEALFSPADALAAHGDGLPEVPPAVVLGYQDSLHEVVRERAGDSITLVGNQRLYPLSDAVGFVGDFGIGAPVTAGVVENVIAAGAEVVCILGGCGCLQADIAPDDAVLPTWAIRDEGASYHYLAPDESVEATSALVDALDDSLTRAGFDTHRGPTWTTSAFYRETIPEVRLYAEEGVLSVEMETATLLAVATYRGVDAAAVHQVGDYLASEEWTPDGGDVANLVAMLDPTIAALERYVK